MSSFDKERPKHRYRKFGSMVVAVKAPGSYEVDKWERNAWARQHTRSLRLWWQRLIGSALVAGVAILALRAFGSASGPWDELIVAAVTLFFAFILLPLGEYGWRYLRAGEHLAIEKARELEIDVDRLSGELDNEREKTADPENPQVLTRRINELIREGMRIAGELRVPRRVWHNPLSGHPDVRRAMEFYDRVFAALPPAHAFDLAKSLGPAFASEHNKAHELFQREQEEARREGREPRAVYAQDALVIVDAALEALSATRKELG